MAGLRLPGKARKFIAVDFDSRHLRVVQAQHTGGVTRVLKLTQVDMPEEMDLADPTAVGQFLGRTLKDLRLSGTGVLMNVPRGQAVLKPLTLPTGADRDELANMVRFQVERDLPYDVAEAVIDYTITSHFDVDASQESAASGVNVLAAVAKLSVVDHYRQIAEAANIRLLRLGLRPYASLRCADACTVREEDEAVAVVFLTADETEINVLVGSSLTFSRSAVLKIAPPISGSDPAVKETVDSLVTEIGRSLQSYQTVHGGRKVDAVLLAGGTGVESRVAQELAKRMKIGCETFDPSGALGLRESSPDTSAFIAAIGLAIAHHGPALAFDFLAPKRPKVRRDMRKVRMYAAAGFAALALLACVFLVNDHLSGKEADVLDLRAEHKKLKKEAKTVRDLGRYVSAVQEWEDQGRDWLDHWAYLCGLFPSCEHVYIDRFKTSRVDGSVVFTVMATDSAWIDQLSANLTKAGYEFRRGVSTSADINKEEYRHKTDMKILVPKNRKVDLAVVEAKPRPPDDISLEKFRPGEKLPAAGGPRRGGGPMAARERGVIYSPAKPTTANPKPGGAPAKPDATAGLNPQEQQWRKEFEKRMASYWQRELERQKRKHKGPVTRELIAKWRGAFEKKIEPYWQKELARRRKGAPSRRSGSSDGRKSSDRRRRGSGR